MTVLSPKIEYKASLIVWVGSALLWVGCSNPENTRSVEVSEESAAEPLPELADGMIQPIRLAPDAPVDYNFHVKPILSNNCFACHGFDPNTRESGLRLDTPEGATANYAPEGEAPLYAVVPGDPESSEIWKRINHTNDQLRMPPVDSHKPALNEEEKSIIRRWIEQGAEYKDHWSYITPEKPPVPAVQDESWPRNNIDRFVLEKIETLGATPSEEADKETLLRRLSFDLTGLPPTPADTDAFLADESPDAYEKAVERLMASPHYGERMAVEWLDVARYGDTNAHHVDMARTSWPWRDWVIDAFNDNKPYDTFIVEQVAGDLLENPTRDQVLATSFNRNHPITNEGGAIPEEYLLEYASDRVHTVSTAFLGMTMACTRCHDHKYDPYSMEDYYGMLSFFNNIPEKGLESQNIREAEGYRPFVYFSEDESVLDMFDDYQEQLKSFNPSINQAELNKRMSEARDAHNLSWVRMTSPFTQALWNGKKVKGPKGRNFRLILNEAQQETLIRDGGVVEFDIAVKGIPTDKNLLFLHLQNRQFNRSDMKKSGKLWDVSSKVNSIELSAVSGPQDKLKEVVPLGIAAHWSTDFGLGLSEEISKAFDQNVNTSWELQPGGRPLSLVLELESALNLDPKTQRLRLSIRFEKGSFPPVQNNMLTIYAGSSDRALGNLIQEVDPVSLVSLSPENIRNQYAEQSRWEWALYQGKKDLEAFQKWADMKDQLSNLSDSLVRVAVMSENPKPRATYILDRGAYDAPLKDRPVERQIPTVFGEMDPEYPKDRLGFAYWLVQDDNPLTARVTVNRYWQMIFGTGLVKTSEDFGAQGELPSHPELLDYLAVEFIESGWDTKALIRKMVTSATYRQESTYRSEMQLADPENRLLSWFPRQRLQAEFIRDNALSASGLLVPKIGGPSVKPYQPAGLWREKAMRKDNPTGTFARDSGEKLYRRGMYTFWKQVAPPPQMEAFDAPSREVCITQRNITNTPMQALTLLNDETYLEASRKMAARIFTELPGPWEETLEARVTLAYRYLTGRKPSDNSLNVLSELARDSYQDFSAEGAEPESFLAYGESPRNEAIDPIEHASLALTASAVLNLDKTITRD